MSANNVTLRDVYDIVNRLEAKIDDRLEDHEKRIRETENFRARVLGISGVVAAFIGALASYVVEKLTGRS